jgi:phage major head subunit gpT-like protein
MDISRPGVSQAIYQNLRTDFQKGIENYKPIAKPIYQVVPSTGDANVYSWLGHMPGFKEMYKGKSRILRNVQTFEYRVANRKFEDTIVIDEDDVSDNQLGQYKTAASSLAAAGMQIYDQLVFELLNNAFASTTCYDGAYLISDTHTVGISTLDNKGTAALSDNALEAAINAMAGWTYKADKASTSTPLNPSLSNLHLVVPPALKSTAEKLVNLQRSSSGADNYLYGQAKVLVSAWLSSSTAWFLVNVGGPVAPIFIQEREKLKMEQKTSANSDIAFMEQKLIYGAKMRLAALPTYPWLFYGSTGAST